MKKLICSVSLMALLLSCNSGGGGSSAPAKPLNEQLAEANSAMDFTATIKSNSFSMIKANLNYNEQKERYTLGCKTQGEPSWDQNKLDTRLDAGMIYRVQEGRSAIITTDYYQITEREIISVGLQKLVMGISIEIGSFTGTPFTSIDQVFISKPHITESVNFTTKPDGTIQSDYSYTANYTQSALEYLQSHPSENSYLSCSTSYDMNAPSIHTVDKISYQMNGRPVLAYLVKESREGEISCGMRKYGDSGENDNDLIKMGTGRLERVEIYTNEIVHQGIMTCGGASVFRTEKIVLSSGKVVKTEVIKTLLAPNR